MQYCLECNEAILEGEHYQETEVGPMHASCMDYYVHFRKDLIDDVERTHDHER